ncbi:hypothetical protein CPB86DRAFT_876103 [Serendipita vermifera]|nr:hypothetical protein CPB86DRAFT_876103 [Serendipita vermifera]
MESILDLPFPHSRKLPSNTEVRQCKAAISVLDQGIEEIRMQVQKLEKQIEDLDRKRANYASYISPFRRLPVEILSEIFTLCLHNGTRISTLTSIHGGLRGVILGMPLLWRRIHLEDESPFNRPSFSRTLPGSIKCFSRRQLEAALAQAGSTPLQLKIHFPVGGDVLELISSRRTPIEHITFTGHYSRPPPTHHIVNFNFNFLCKLQIDYAFPDVLAIMDLALKSTRNHFELYLEMERTDLMVPIFTHPLLQRLTFFKLYLVPDNDAHLEVTQYLNTIPLPRLKKFQFTTEPALLALFDLRSVEILEVKSYFLVLDLQEQLPPPDSIMTSPPPTHLVQLKLTCIMLDFATSQPYRFPNLVMLTLREVGFRAPFRDYIEAPNLKELSLSLVVFESPNGGLLTSAPPVFDTQFFQGLPALKDLFLAKMSDIEDAVVDSLRFWSSLQTLTIEKCSFNKFMSSFITGIKDGSFLPRLTHLSIRESWDPQLTMSYIDFRERCQAQRPRLDIQADDLTQRLPLLLSRPT